MTQTEVSPPRKKPVSRFELFFFGALGGILFGYDLGIISGVLPFVSEQWSLHSGHKGMLTASVSLGAMIGAGFSTRLNDKLGRRGTIQIAAVLVFVATIAATFAPGFWLLVTARTVIGVGVGFSSATVPTYLSELAPARLRGALGTLNQIFIVTGILIAFLMGYFLGASSNWRAMLAGAAVPAVILFLGLIRLPETPRWLMQHGRPEDAKTVIHQTNPVASDAERELASLQEVIAEERSHSKPKFRELFGPLVLPMLIVALLLAAGQQFSGVNAINAYFPTMLIDLGFEKQAALLSGVGLGLGKFIFTIVVIFVVDRWGRRPLTLLGSILMAVTLAGAGVVAFTVQDTGLRGILMLVLIIFYLVGYELGWGAVVWVMMSEVFPLRNRAAGVGLATVVLWAATGVVTAIFPLISDAKALGIGGAMFLFAGVNVVLFFLTRWLVPETKGRTLEEIELDLHGSQARKVRKQQTAHHQG